MIRWAWRAHDIGAVPALHLEVSVTRVLVCMTAAIVAFSCVAIGETAEVTVWKIPVRLTNLFDICLAEEGQVFVALPGSRAVALVDPLRDEARLLPVGESPISLALTDEGLFFTFYGGIGLLDSKTGETATWRMPGAAGVVRSLVEGEFGTAAVTLWFAQGSPDKVGVFEPSSIALTSLDGDEPEVLALERLRTDIRASSAIAEPETYSVESPLLSRTIGAYEENFRRWSPLVHGRGVDRLAVGSKALMWFSQGGDALFLFEPWSDSIFRYRLANGTKAVAVTASPSGEIWFIDSAHRAVGRLDPTVNEVTSWSVPEGAQPFDITIGSHGKVWISDRASGVIYRLDPGTDEFQWWQIKPGSSPSILRVGESGSVWFIEETEKAVGRLTLSEP